MKPLSGITVLDLTRLLPGAYATQILADQGAEVVKVEQPGSGDYARTLSPAVFRRTNAGKKSVALDLKQPQGKRALLAMIPHADILIEGFRPGVMTRLGLDYAALQPVNPRLIYVSLTGYGQTGPNATLAGHDINYIALGGVLGLNLPVIPGVQIGDLVGGSLQAVIRILLALQARHTSGQGEYIDVSMTAGVESLLIVPMSQPTSGESMLTGRYACYRLYRGRDGRWLAVGALESKFWAELCRRLGCEDLIPAQFDETRQPELKARLAEIFLTQDAETWFEELRHSDCCVTPVRTLAELADGPPEGRAPEVGEHTAELLARYGYG